MNQTADMVVYGCLEEERRIIGQVFEGFGLSARFVEEEMSVSRAPLAQDCSCVSVSHRTALLRSELQALKDAGVECIITRSVGLDHIDAEAAEDMGLTVRPSPYSPGSVADYTMMLILLALRCEARSSANAIGGGIRKITCGRELSDLTVGIVGPGRIGTAVAERLKGFGCEIMIAGRARPGETPTLPELLPKVDVLTLHVPLTAETTHLIGRDEIALMKHDAIVVNTGRGELIETPALLDALKEGRLGGAALDVVEGENSGRYSEALEALPNTIVTPHKAYYTRRALSDIATSMAKSYLEFERSCEENE